MKIVAAIDSFKGSMTSMEAGQAAAEGIHRVDADAEVIVRPLADGGEGTVEALVSGMNGTLQKVQVTGPLGEPVICEYGIIESTKTAVIEMAGAAGITLVSDEERNPLNTTTYGVGEVIRDAIDKGCRRFLVGIGGSATNDGEGRMDGQTAMGKAPVGVAALAKKYKKLVLAFAGAVERDARKCNEHGIDAFFPILRGVVTLEEAMKNENAKQNLADTAEQVYRTFMIH